MEDGDKPHPYIGGSRLLSPRLRPLVFYYLAKDAKKCRSLGEEVQANAIRLQGAALVAVRNNLNKKMFADGHEGRALQQSDTTR